MPHDRVSRLSLAAQAYSELNNLIDSAARLCYHRAERYKRPYSQRWRRGYRSPHVPLIAVLLIMPFGGCMLPYPKHAGCDLVTGPFRLLLPRSLPG